MAFSYRIHDQHKVYFLTCTVHQWVDVFSRKHYADIIIDSLKHCQQHKGLQLYGWVIMTNHIHMIASCEPPNRLSDVLRDFKKYTSKQVFNAISEHPQESRKRWMSWLLKEGDDIQFWESDNHAMEINSRDFFAQKLNYIHQNPVRANITDVEEAYLWQEGPSGINFRRLNIADCKSAPSFSSG